MTQDETLLQLRKELYELCVERATSVAAGLRGLKYLDLAFMADTIVEQLHKREGARLENREIPAGK